MCPDVAITRGWFFFFFFFFQKLMQIVLLLESDMRPAACWGGKSLFLRDINRRSTRPESGSAGTGWGRQMEREREREQCTYVHMYMYMYVHVDACMYSMLCVFVFLPVNPTGPGLLPTQSRFPSAPVFSRVQYSTAAPRYPGSTPHARVDARAPSEVRLLAISASPAWNPRRSLVYTHVYIRL